MKFIKLTCLISNNPIYINFSLVTIVSIQGEETIITYGSPDDYSTVKDTPGQ